MDIEAEKRVGAENRREEKEERGRKGERFGIRRCMMKKSRERRVKWKRRMDEGD